MCFACIVTCQKLSSPPFRDLAAPPLNLLKKAQAFIVTESILSNLYITSQQQQKRNDNQLGAPVEVEAPIEDGDDEEITVHHLKCYVCLFTCARAVHLALVPDLSARSFLLVSQRFQLDEGHYHSLHYP